MMRSRTPFPLRACAHWLTLTLCALLLAACAGGSKRPDPAPLPPLTDEIGASQAWSYKLPGKVNFPLRVQVQGERLLLASDDGTVVTLDAGSGRELGRVSAGAGLTAGVGSDGRVAAVVTRRNDLVALNSDSVRWTRRLPTQSYAAPLVAGGRIFVLGADRSVYAFDAGTGARLWTAERPEEPLVLRQSGVLFAANNMLLAGLSGRLVAIEPDRGLVLWEAPLATPRGTDDVERLVDLVGASHRDGSRSCARAFEAAVACVDLRDGQVLWSRKARGTSGLAGDDLRLFGTESNGRVRAWRSRDGSPDWENSHFQWRRLTEPLTLGRSVVFGDDEGWVHFLSRTEGRELGRVRVDRSGLAAAPVAAANRLVVVTHAGTVHAFTPR